MSAVVVPLHKCGCCGTNLGLPRRLHYKGDKPIDVFSCPVCAREIKRNLKRVRPVARVLKQIGLDPDMVQDVMLYLLEQLDEEDDARRKSQS